MVCDQKRERNNEKMTERLKDTNENILKRVVKGRERKEMREREKEIKCEIKWEKEKKVKGVRKLKRAHNKERVRLVTEGKSKTGRKNYSTGYNATLHNNFKA